MIQRNTFSKLTRVTASGCALGLAVAASPAAAEMGAAPLAQHPHQLVNFETAYQLDKNQLSLWTGTHQTHFGIDTPGTGNQIYYGGGAFGLTDRLQVGYSHQVFQDPPPTPIRGSLFPIRVEAGALQAKYSLIGGPVWTVAVQGSIEGGYFRNMTGTEASTGTQVIGSLHVPVSFAPNDRFAFHILPGVSFLPDSVGPDPFFGTVATLGAGVTWKPTERLAAYGSVNVPLSGGNTVESSGAIGKMPVWTLGARYNVTPKMAVDLFATNGLGTTPATRILTFMPDGDTTMIGALVTYTPGRGPGYEPNYRGLPGEPLSMRQRHLQRDGFTLSSADTFTPGAVVLTAFGGTQGHHGGGIQVSPDYDITAEALYEQRADDGSVGPDEIPGTEPNWAGGLKLRLLDQNNGSAISLAGRAVLGRDTDGDGTFFVSLPMMYKVSDRLALLAEPKFAAWGDVTKYGLGVGVNVMLSPRLEAIGEITPVNEGEPLVWAAGLRYFVPGSGLSLDLSASNAIGRHGLGTMVGQDDVKVSFGATLALDASGLRR